MAEPSPSPGHIVIVGGVAAGATAAARIRRLSEAPRITLLERSPYVSYANCGLPYYIGGDIKVRQDSNPPRTVTAGRGVTVASGFSTPIPNPHPHRSATGSSCRRPRASASATTWTSA